MIGSCNYITHRRRTRVFQEAFLASLKYHDFKNKHYGMVNLIADAKKPDGYYKDQAGQDLKNKHGLWIKIKVGKGKASMNIAFQLDCRNVPNHGKQITHGKTCHLVLHHGLS
jgi:hypothetical protein